MSDCLKWKASEIEIINTIENKSCGFVYGQNEKRIIIKATFKKADLPSSKEMEEKLGKYEDVIRMLFYENSWGDEFPFGTKIIQL